MTHANAAAAVPASETLTLLPSIAADAVTAIGPADRVPRPCRFGFLREVCIDDGKSFVCFASTEPGSASPWHNHGASTTYALLLEGEGAVEFANHERMDLRADGTVYVIPPHLEHREINTGTTRNQILVMRVFPCLGKDRGDGGVLRVRAHRARSGDGRRVRARGKGRLSGGDSRRSVGGSPEFGPSPQPASVP